MVETEWTVILASRPRGRGPGAAPAAASPRAPCSSGGGPPAVAPGVQALRRALASQPPRWLRSCVHTVLGLASSEGAWPVARQAPLLYRWGDTELVTCLSRHSPFPPTPSVSPPHRPRPRVWPRAACAPHSPPAATHSLASAVTSRGVTLTAPLSPHFHPGHEWHFRRNFPKCSLDFRL